ncbi:MAG: hypothetical protein AAFX87_09975, partial [Bacteroidota bacterium]
MEEGNNGFLELWHLIMLIGAIASLSLSFLIYVIHVLKFSSIKAPKAKYDYLRENEIKRLKWCFFSLGAAVFFFANMYGASTLKFDIVWFLVRLFISLSAGTLVGYVAALILDNYYPTRLHKKLNKWRYMPRVNANTGNKMRLLSEKEEDVHLDEGMQAEEEAFSVDYDVWVDDQTAEVKIEKYPGHLVALQCGSCGFYTMKVQREEVTLQPTDSEGGELLKHYECTYCGSTRTTQFNIAPLKSDAQYTIAAAAKLSNDLNIIKIEITLGQGEKRIYEFQDVDQATKFLK